MANGAGRNTVRVPETDDGLQGGDLASKYDEMQRHIRDRGWLQEKVDGILNAGIADGTALEMGCGPGYLGLEWMSQVTADVRLVGLDISLAMLSVARDNAHRYGFNDRCTYDLGSVLELPYHSNSFDHVFSASSLHEWVDPVLALSEMLRVVNPGGSYCVSDLRRDIDRTTFQFMKANIAVDMRPGFGTSVRAAYVKDEVRQIVQAAGLNDVHVTEIQMGILIWGKKESK
jgi:ubiquinone/menaquinone biosynthesis C-methylase UbiE